MVGHVPFWRKSTSERMPELRRDLIVSSIDVELPLEVDDEYLVEREQPAGKPSQLSYFVSAIKLAQIAGLVLRTIVSSTDLRLHPGVAG